MTLRHMKIFVAVYQQKSISRIEQPASGSAVRQSDDQGSWRNIIISACSTASPDGFTRRRTGIASMNMHSISCHFFQKWKTKSPPGMQMPAPYWLQHHLGICLIPPLSKAYQEQHPEIKIYVTVKIPAQSSRAIVDNQLDFALVEGTVTTRKSFQRSFFCRCRLGAWSSSPDTIRLLPTGRSPRRRCFTPSPLREPGSAGREIVESLFIRRYPDHARLGKRQHLALIRAAQNGLGIAILLGASRPGCAEIRGSPLPLPPDILTGSLYLIRHTTTFSSSAEEFLNLCRMWKFWRVNSNDFFHRYTPASRRIAF